MLFGVTSDNPYNTVKSISLLLHWLSGQRRQELLIQESIRLVCKTVEMKYNSEKATFLFKRIICSSFKGRKIHYSFSRCFTKCIKIFFILQNGSNWMMSFDIDENCERQDIDKCLTPLTYLILLKLQC